MSFASSTLSCLHLVSSALLYNSQSSYIFIRQMAQFGNRLPPVREVLPSGMTQCVYTHFLRSVFDRTRIKKSNYSFLNPTPSVPSPLLCILQLILTCFQAICQSKFIKITLNPKKSIYEPFSFVHSALPFRYTF